MEFPIWVFGNGALFEGPHNKGSSFIGAFFGTPYFSNLPYLGFTLIVEL